MKRLAERFAIRPGEGGFEGEFNACRSIGCGVCQEWRNKIRHNSLIVSASPLMGAAISFNKPGKFRDLQRKVGVDGRSLHYESKPAFNRSLFDSPSVAMGPPPAQSGQDLHLNISADGGCPDFHSPVKCFQFAGFCSP